MKINTKYNIDQKLYILNELMYKKPCKICNGKMYITLAEQVFDCPCCKGVGWVWSEDNKWQVNIYDVDSIWVSIDSSIEITYRVYRNNKDRTKNPSCEIPCSFDNIKECDLNVFASIEEVLAECYKRNGYSNDSN